MIILVGLLLKGTSSKAHYNMLKKRNLKTCPGKDILYHILPTLPLIKEMYLRAAAGLMTSFDFFYTYMFNPFQPCKLWNYHIYLQLHNKCGSETVYISWGFDVKEMYNWLLQQDIIKAIEWVLKHMERKSRRSHITVFYKEI